MFAQKVVAVLAVAGLAAAQTGTICSAPSVTINSAADASALANCATLAGDVIIGPSAGGVININGPQIVRGAFISENAGGLTSLGSTTITSIEKEFTLTNLTLLSTLSMSTLKSVGSIKWSALPAISALSFTAIVTKADSVLITNTFLSSLDGINLQTVAVLDINNNNRLKKFDTQVANVTQLLQIDSNGQALEVSFPNLIWAANATFRNASSVSIPSLAVVNGSLGFYGNNFESIAAPNLTTVGSKSDGGAGGGIAFVANSDLANISFPMLESVAGANQVANNSKLAALEFPALSTVGGAIDFSGNFTTPLLPALTLVSGGFNIQSTNQIDCTTFDKQQKNAAILGVYTCKTTADAKSGVGSSTSSGSGSSTTSRAAAASYGINEAIAGVSVIGGLLQMLL
ncbi:hypothetical protein HYFRA_00007459 [Hymenoscyphus fraxineus]|uniref:GPI-anchored cell wall organization protein Ecm33 n=1 Tax=Hymenoscyphus fraxineus TaxID=746836 RepID=A0A9N9KR77_9HELO|nr:hypothetical protein HYFRA_00007459 [Hymenoscyphus fraxineus]